MGSEYIQSDKYLQDIVRDKRYWETKRQNIRKREKQMEDTIARYEQEIQELERSRKEILKKAKEEAERLLQESNAKIENTIRTIKEAQAEKERTRTARQELTDFKQQVENLEKAALEEKIARKMEKLREKQERKKDKKAKQANAPETPVAPKVRPIEAGDYVRIKGQTSVGQVMEISGKNAVVMFGLMKTNVKAERLERTDAPKAAPLSSKATFVSSETQDRMYEKKLNFKQDIDVRGMRGDEAIQAVTYFIDDAILVGVSRVRILHGTGTGILRTLIRQYLATVPGVAHFQDEHVQFGGAGITVVDLKINPTGFLRIYAIIAYLCRKLIPNFNMKSIRELYRIGTGPSSSHTMAPQSCRTISCPQSGGCLIRSNSVWQSGCHRTWSHDRCSYFGYPATSRSRRNSLETTYFLSFPPERNDFQGFRCTEEKAG